MKEKAQWTSRAKNEDVVLVGRAARGARVEVQHPPVGRFLLGASLFLNGLNCGSIYAKTILNWCDRRRHESLSFVVPRV
jgi:hypothetical protein